MGTIYSIGGIEEVLNTYDSIYNRDSSVQHHDLFFLQFNIGSNYTTEQVEHIKLMHKALKENTKEFGLTLERSELRGYLIERSNGFYSGL